MYFTASLQRCGRLQTTRAQSIQSRVAESVWPGASVVLVSSCVAANVDFHSALCSQPVPDAWELHEEAEQNARENMVDPLLQERIQQLEDDQHFEAEELTFADELKQMASFAANADDESKTRNYILQRVPPILKRELNEYILHRTSTFAARRQGGAVQSISAESDRVHRPPPLACVLSTMHASIAVATCPCPQTALLRFFGYLQHTNRVPVGVSLETVAFMIRDDVGTLVEAYATWLQQDRTCKFSTIANYLNGLVCACPAIELWTFAAPVLLWC